MTVVLRLSEHDAHQLKLLIKRQEKRTEQTCWHGYWRRLAAEVDDQVGRAYEQWQSA